MELKGSLAASSARRHGEMSRGVRGVGGASGWEAERRDGGREEGVK